MKYQLLLYFSKGNAICSLFVCTLNPIGYSYTVLHHFVLPPPLISWVRDFISFFLPSHSLGPAPYSYYFASLILLKSLFFTVDYKRPFCVEWAQQRPVGSKVQHTGPMPMDRFSIGNQAFIAPRSLWDLLFAKTSPPCETANIYCICLK